MADSPDPNPYTASLTYGGDFELTPSGSLVMVTGVEKFRQRVIRRFFTNPSMVQNDGTYLSPDYLFDTDYGMGAARLVGEKVSDDIAAQFKQKLRAAIMIDEGVDVSREPMIKVFQNDKGAVWAEATAYLIQDGAQTFNIPIKNSSG